MVHDVQLTNEAAKVYGKVLCWEAGLADAGMYHSALVRPIMHLDVFLIDNMLKLSLISHLLPC